MNAAARLSRVIAGLVKLPGSVVTRLGLAEYQKSPPTYGRMSMFVFAGRGQFFIGEPERVKQKIISLNLSSQSRLTGQPSSLARC